MTERVESREEVLQQLAEEEPDTPVRPADIKEQILNFLSNHVDELICKGEGLDMTYASKGFSVECLSAEPGPDKIIYTGNPENDCLKAQHRRH